MRFRSFLLLWLALGVSLAPSSALANDGTRLRTLLRNLVSAGGAATEAERISQSRAALVEDGAIVFKLIGEKSREKIFRQAGFTDLGMPTSPLLELGNLPGIENFNDWEKKTMEIRKKIIDSVPDELILEASEKIDEVIQAVPVSKLPAMKMVLEEIPKISMPGFEPSDLKFFAEGFLRYFDRIPARFKRRMLTAWLSLPASAGQAAQVREVVQNSGPALQKILQALGKESKNAELTSITQELLSNVKAVPFDEIRAVVEAEYGKPLEELFSEVDPERVGTASVGQTHRVVTLDGEEGIMKALKPNIHSDMDDDLAVFREVMADNAVSADLVEVAGNNFQRELDLRFEAAGLEEGAVYRDKAKGIDVPKVLKSVPPSKNVLVMSLAPGKNLNKSGHVDPLLRGQALVNLYEKWFGEAEFGSGFFHGDLHPGNIMYMELPGEKPPFLTTPIDFGGRGKLDLEQRRKLLYFFAAIQEENAENALDALSAFGNLEKVDQGSLLVDFEKVLKKKIGAEEKMNELIGLALANKAKLHENILLYSRANLFLYNELFAINLEIAAKHPGHPLFRTRDIYLRVALRSLGDEILDRILLRHNGEFFWDSAVIREVFSAVKATAWRGAKNSCGRMFDQIAP